MLEVMKKDSEIKLFGRTICLPPDMLVSDFAEPDILDKKQGVSATPASQDNQDVSEGELTRSKQEWDSDYLTEAAFVETEKGSLSPKTSKKNEPSEINVSQEKTLSKPDQVLPCPRCNSKETKFCYYNNYNVSQPRHFCKKCQRYWTAGGTMRNVPVGSGRRKTKNASIANYFHIMVPDAHALPNGMQFPLKPNGTLVFGSDRPFTKSIVSTPNPAERSQNCGGSEIFSQSSGSSCTTSNSTVKGSDTDIQESSFPQISWPWPLHSPQWIQNSQAVATPCFPVTFYPAPPYFGCTLPTSWNVPLASPPPSSGYSGITTNPSASTLRKHSRDGTVLKSTNLETEEFSVKKSTDARVLIPKTLRIDDPIEAAKSSIWSALGINNQKINSTNGENLFKSFKPKGDSNRNINNSTLVLQANPAALSRWLNYRESTKCD